MSEASAHLVRSVKPVARPPSEDLRRAAHTVSLGEPDASVAEVIEALPDPAELAPGALVIVLGSSGAPSFARSVLAVFGRAKVVPRAIRCSALVARGYVRVGAAGDARADLAWGYAPATEPG